MINIPKLLPLVRKHFPQVPLPKILKAMNDFAKAHPNLTDNEAAQAFQVGMQQSQQSQAPQPPFQGLMNQIPTGVK